MPNLVTSGYTSICTANGRMVPEELPQVREGDTVRVAFNLKPFLAGDTISGTYTVTDEPDELTIADVSRWNDSTQIEADVSGFREGQTYCLQVSATLTGGSVINKRVRIKCADDFPW